VGNVEHKLQENEDCRGRKRLNVQVRLKPGVMEGEWVDEGFKNNRSR
jgi:hypothetical protein